ncbi:hypothetical protein KIPB_011324 [Kipferlia bialata]|uniref:Uncharacterized protein n=1 Tax=Kipferlia bialata TaxID=797122 RepID=A0A391NSQ4_9EUKA|nr:hypothetical protein KIPB_011324 [Kipferlia bialata]|eukprot:g11324.t1
MRRDAAQPVTDVAGRASTPRRSRTALVAVKEEVGGDTPTPRQRARGPGGMDADEAVPPALDLTCCPRRCLTKRSGAVARDKLVTAMRWVWLL